MLWIFTIRGACQGPAITEPVAIGREETSRRALSVNPHVTGQSNDTALR